MDKRVEKIKKNLIIQIREEAIKIHKLNNHKTIYIVGIPKEYKKRENYERVR